MAMNTTNTQDIDDYIAGFPADIQVKLKKMRSTIKKAAPEALETINYQMPTFQLKGNLVHFAAFKNHVGFYPAPSAIENFNMELSAYKSSKGAVQFPLDQPIPYDLVSKIVKFRVKENIEKAALKKGLKGAGKT